jgi:hypothetical protein
MKKNNRNVELFLDFKKRKSFFHRILYEIKNSKKKYIYVQ